MSWDRKIVTVMERANMERESKRRRQTDGALGSRSSSDSESPDSSVPPVLFLDLDGVLHSVDAQPGDFFDKRCMLALHRLLQSSNAEVVLSSTWRLSTQLREEAYLELGQRAIHPIGDTPRRHSRAAEITAWLDENGFACATCTQRNRRWLALDDLPLELPTDHVVQTDPLVGLTEADVDAALQKLQTRAVD